MTNDFPTAEDIEIVYQSERCYNGYLMIGDIIPKEQLESLKQQIISNNEKAEKYDLLMKANSDIVQHNIDITSEHQIVERLKAEIKLFDEPFDNNDANERRRMILKILKSILEKK